MCHDGEELCKIWRGNDLLQEWHEDFDKFWPEHLKVSKIFTLMHSFWAKYILFELKKYWGVIFKDTEVGYKIWRGINLSFQNWHKQFDMRSYLLWQWRVMHNLKKNWLVVWKWHEEYGKFSLEHLIVSKFELWLDPLIQSRKSISLKILEQLCVVTLKNDAKFEEEMICFKNDIRHLMNFELSTWKSKKFSL